MNVWYENHFLMPTKKMSLVFHDVSIWINIKQREEKISFPYKGKKIDERTAMDVRLSIFNKIIYNKRTCFYHMKTFQVHTFHWPGIFSPDSEH